MITVSEDFKKAVKEPIRQLNSFVELLVDGRYIRGYEQLGRISSEDKAEITVLDTTIDDNSAFCNYASLEEDYFLLDGSFILPNRSNNKETGFIGDINSSTLNINNIDYEFDDYLNKRCITIYFENGYATDFSISLDVDYVGYATKTITYNYTNNDKKIITTDYIKDSAGNPTSYIAGFKNIKNISITINNWSNSNHRVRIRQVNLGETVIYESNEIIEINTTEQTDIYNIDIPNNECNIKLNNYDRKFNIVDENNILNRLNSNSVFRIYYGISINGSYEYVCMGNYEFSSYDDENNYYTILNGVGIIGTLDKDFPVMLNDYSTPRNANFMLEHISRYIDSDVKYNQTIPMEYTKFNNKREQLQAITILSESVIKQTRVSEYYYNKNKINVLNLKENIVDTIDLDRQLEQPKFTKRNIINKFIIKNDLVGSLNESEQTITEEKITPYYDLTNRDYRYRLRLISNNPIKEDTIKIYINNSLYSNYYINGKSYYQIEIILYHLQDDYLDLKVTAQTYNNEEQIYNYNMGNEELIEYNNNYLRNNVDKNRVANYNIQSQKPFGFEFKMMYDPSLEVTDTILFENVDGYKKGVITSIECKYNGALTATIKGECENVL